MNINWDFKFIDSLIFFSNFTVENNGIFLSFSLIKNIKDLLAYDKDNELNFLNGHKFLMMLAVLFGHRFMSLSNTPLSNTVTYESVSIVYKMEGKSHPVYIICYFRLI